MVSNVSVLDRRTNHSPVEGERRPEEPLARRGTEDRDVRLAVAIVVARTGEVGCPCANASGTAATSPTKARTSANPLRRRRTVSSGATKKFGIASGLLKSLRASYACRTSFCVVDGMV